MNQNLRKFCINLTIINVLCMLFAFPLYLGVITGIEEIALAEAQQQQNASVQKIHKMGETVRVGYMVYRLNEALWMGTKYIKQMNSFNEAADANYLILGISVKNVDKEARIVPPIKLIDENGAIYTATHKLTLFKGMSGIMADLNPGVQKNAFVVFDLPKTHNYKLKVLGGYYSKEEALIEVKPKEFKAK